jgi:hypothetical protein
MLIPFRLRSSAGFADPLSSDRCEIEQHFAAYYSPVGGYYSLEIENLPAISCSKVDQSYSKILKILGIRTH